MMLRFRHEKYRRYNCLLLLKKSDFNRIVVQDLLSTCNNKNKYIRGRLMGRCMLTEPSRMNLINTDLLFSLVLS